MDRVGATPPRGPPAQDHSKAGQGGGKLRAIKAGMGREIVQLGSLAVISAGLPLALVGDAVFPGHRAGALWGRELSRPTDAARVTPKHPYGRGRAVVQAGQHTVKARRQVDVFRLGENVRLTIRGMAPTACRRESIKENEVNTVHELSIDNHVSRHCGCRSIMPGLRWQHPGFN